MGDQLFDNDSRRDRLVAALRTEPLDGPTTPVVAADTDRVLRKGDRCWFVASTAESVCGTLQIESVEVYAEYDLCVVMGEGDVSGRARLRQAPTRGRVDGARTVLGDVTIVDAE